MICDLYIGREQLLVAPVLVDIVLPHGAEDGLHIVRGVGRVIRQSGRVPPQCGLGDNNDEQIGW